MKPYRIFTFIILIIASLGLISFFFPKDGITLFGAEIRFPTLEKVLVGETLNEVAVADEVDSVELEHLRNLRDTLQQYRPFFTEQRGRFYLPDDDIRFFDKLFARMERAQSDREVVRVLHYGDSQIEMDRLSHNLRSYLQGVFGGGGPGLVPVIQTIPSFAVSQSASGDLTLYSSYGDGQPANGNYGLMAKCYRLTGSATFAAYAARHKDTDTRVKRFSNITLLYNHRSGGFSATLRNRKSGYAQTCNGAEPGVRTCHWLLDTPATAVTMNLSGDADLYGIFLDDGYGVAVDNIPLRGSSGTQFTMISESILRACYENANVGMIILQFGGNTVPAIYSQESIEKYCDRIEQQIQYVQRCCPDATLLFIGPSDMSTHKGGLHTYPLLPQLIDSLKAVVLRNHAAYWDLYEVMGGENSMVAWVKNGLAGPDYIHFTPAGAEKVGDMLAGNFSKAYEFYKIRSRIPQTQFDTLWTVSAK